MPAIRSRASGVAECEPESDMLLDVGRGSVQSATEIMRRLSRDVLQGYGLHEM